jgi:hypothetical protein
MAGVVVSADSHVMEPATLWTERLDKKFQDKAPKVVKTESGTFSFVAPGIVPFPVLLPASVSARTERNSGSI